MEVVKPKRVVEDMSGFCRHSGHHHLCSWPTETPSAVVLCVCECHDDPAPTPTPAAKVLVPKK